MFPNFNNKNQKDNKNAIDKNLKMMSISAIVLIVLFGYTLIKSDNIIQGNSYYIGVGFLFILLILTFALQKYKDKIREMIPKNKFQQELDIAQEIQETKEFVTDDINISSITPTQSTVTFKDIAGIEEVKEELEEVVDFLNNPKNIKSTA